MGAVWPHRTSKVCFLGHSQCSDSLKHPPTRVSIRVSSEKLSSIGGEENSL